VSVTGMDHDFERSECLLIKEEGNVSKGQEGGVLWSIIYRSKHWDRQFF